MRKITFIRDKKFNAAWVTVHIFIDGKYKGPIKSGKTLSLTLEDNSFLTYIKYAVSADPKGVVRQTEPLIVNIKGDVTILVRNKFSFMHGSSFYLKVL